MVSRKLIVRWVALSAMTAAALGLTGAPLALASGNPGHTVSMTENVHGTFSEPNATNPCTGAPGVAEFTGNAVMHVTFFPAGDEVWATFTETGKVTVVWDGVTFTGHATAWGNFNMNEQNANSEFTLTIRVSAADGSSVTGHETAVFVLNANGQVTVNFDKLSFTCT